MLSMDLDRSSEGDILSGRPSTWNGQRRLDKKYPGRRCAHLFVDQG